MRQALVPVLATALCVAACTSSGGPDVRGLDVRGEFSAPDSVAWAEPLRIDFTWRPGPDFIPPERETFVYVHLFDADGELVVQDDHVPEPPPGSWSSGGEAVTYSRWLYPLEPLPGPWIDVHVGLYDGVGKRSYRRDGEWTDHPRIRRIRVREEDRSGLPEYGAGWHPEERGWNGSGRARWTVGDAEATFRDPGTSALLHFRANSAGGWLRGPQAVRLLVDGREVARSVTGEFEPITVRHPVEPGEGDGDDRIRVRIEAAPVVERTLDGARPAETYGVQVTSLYLQRGAPAGPGGTAAGEDGQ